MISAVCHLVFFLINEWIQERPVLGKFIFTSFSTRGRIPSSEPLAESAVWSVVKGYADTCGLSHIKPHDFRRFVGTQPAKKAFCLVFGGSFVKRFRENSAFRCSYPLAQICWLERTTCEVSRACLMSRLTK